MSQETKERRHRPGNFIVEILCNGVTSKEGIKEHVSPKDPERHLTPLGILAPLSDEEGREEGPVESPAVLGKAATTLELSIYSGIWMQLYREAVLITQALQ